MQGLPSIFKEPAVAAIGPGIVVQCEVGAGLDAGVVVLPELDEGAGIRIFQDRADFFNDASVLLLDGVTIRRANEKNGKLPFYPPPE